MFQKRKPTKAGTSGSNLDQRRCEWIERLRRVIPLTAWGFVAKKQRIVDGAKILLDVAKESADWFPPLKSALGGVNALIKHYEVLVKSVVIAHN